MTKGEVVRHRLERATAAFVMAIVTASCGSAADEDLPVVGLVTPTTTAPAPRDPFLWPFASDSPWNTPIGTRATFIRVNTDESVNLLDARVYVYLNAERFSHPVVRSSETDPAVIVGYRSTNTPPFSGDVVELKIPAQAQPSVGDDAHLHVVTPDAVAHEFFQFRRTPTGASTRYYTRTDLTGSGIGSGGTRAYGGSAIAGLLRAWELEQGRVSHALALALAPSQLGRGPVWPAITEDADAETSYLGTIPMGSLVAIPPTFDVKGLQLSPAGETMARALQEYGAYVVDRSKSMTFYGEPGLSAAAVEDIRRDLLVIRPALRLVANNSPTSVGGGGDPVVPLAPPLRLPPGRSVGPIAPAPSAAGG